MVNANEQLIKVFEEIQKEAISDRWSSNLTNYVGHIVINGKTYEVTISIESDLEDMDVDPTEKGAIKLEAI